MSLALVKRAEDLGDAERAPGEAELAGALERPPTFGEARRLRRAPDGSWLLSWREPRIPRSELGAQVNGPWRGNSGPLMFTEHVAPIMEVLDLLSQPDNLDAEMERRDRLVAEDIHRIEEARARSAEEERARLAEASRQRQERQRIEHECRKAEWDRLSSDARALYLVALAVEDGGNVANAIRSVARQLSNGGYGGGPAFPARRWW